MRRDRVHCIACGAASRSAGSSRCRSSCWPGSSPTRRSPTTTRSTRCCGRARSSPAALRRSTPTVRPPSTRSRCWRRSSSWPSTPRRRRPMSR
jgi:hypothetical protein